MPWNTIKRLFKVDKTAVDVSIISFTVIIDQVMENEKCICSPAAGHKTQLRLKKYILIYSMPRTAEKYFEKQDKSEIPL